MGWKNWPSWLKGGIIFFFVHLIISIILFIFFFKGEFNFAGLFALSIDLPLFLFGCSSSDGLTFQRFCYPIAGSLFYFLIGAIIGWIYGKLKSK